MDVLSDLECHLLLERCPVGHLGVVDDDGPYVTPLSYVVNNGHVGFRTGPGRRLDAIEASPRVCFEVSEFDVENGNWASVVAYGTARVVQDPGTASAVVAGLLKKYRQSVDPLAAPARVPGGNPVVVRIELDTITGRQAGSFFSARTRPGRL